MEDPRLALYFLSSFAGLVMVVGGIWLIYKEKIYIDAESKRPIEITTPIGGFKNNYPALTLFALGFFPLIYPLYAIKDIQDGRVRVATVRLKGPVNVRAYPVAVYASSQDFIVEGRGASFSVEVPVFGSREAEYKVLLIGNREVLDTQYVRIGPDTREHDVAFLPPVREDDAVDDWEPVLPPIPADWRVDQP